MITVKVSYQGHRLDLSKVFNSKAMYDIGNEIKLNIIKTTEAGTDVFGQRFKRYKSKTLNVDLRLTGQMLRSFSIKSTALNVQVFLNNKFAIQKAMWNEERKNNSRTFFGISKSSEDIIKRHVDKLLKGI